MSVLIKDSVLKQLLFGRTVTKATGTLTNADKDLFTVAGGRCVITSLSGLVTVAVTIANAYKLKHNPTTGAVDADLCATLDIGTTDTPAGNLLALTGVPSAAMQRSADMQVMMTNYIIVRNGAIEQQSAGTDGEITWTLTYIPYDTGATIVAA